MNETTELQAKIDALERRLDRMEGDREMGIEKLLRRLLPSETRQHLRNARREQLLAMRSFLDSWIEREERGDADLPHRRERITVE